MGGQDSTWTVWKRWACVTFLLVLPLFQVCIVLDSTVCLSFVVAAPGLVLCLAQNVIVCHLCKAVSFEYSKTILCMGAYRSCSQQCHYITSLFEPHKNHYTLQFFLDKSSSAECTLETDYNLSPRANRLLDNCPFAESKVRSTDREHCTRSHSNLMATGGGERAPPNTPLLGLNNLTWITTISVCQDKESMIGKWSQ